MQPCRAHSKGFGPEQRLDTGAPRYTSKLQDALGEHTLKPIKTPAEFLPLKNRLALPPRQPLPPLAAHPQPAGQH